MLGRKNFFRMLLPILFLWLFYTIMNKTGIIREHLANAPSKIEEELAKTNAKIDALTKKFDDTNKQMSAQADQAAAARASLAAVHKS
jgi:septal ring factor EnvC (AmiA/AmiB activator)